MLFDRKCALVGMVHLLPLPGSSGWGGSMAAVTQRARQDAEALAAGGCDAIIVENMGDVPYLPRQVAPETLTAFTVAAAEVVRVGLPTGIQVLAGANVQALAIAHAVDAHFVRAEAFAYAHVADEGWLDASAGPLLRARAALGCAVSIWADIKKKHAAHAVTADVSLAETARGTAFCGADVLVVTGSATGAPTSLGDVADAKSAGLPVAVGSGVTPADAASLARRADALIVGTWFKEKGDWRASVDRERVGQIRALLP